MNESQPNNAGQGQFVSRRTWTGKKLALFTGKTQFRLSKINELVYALNAILNASVSRGTADKVDISDDNWHLQIGGGSGSGGGGVTQITSVDRTVTITPGTGFGPVVDLSVNAGAIVELTFQGIGFGGNNDFITCSGLRVRMPPCLRFSEAHRVVDGIAINYSAYSTAQQSRVATSGGFDVTQYITRQYAPGDIIYAASVGGVLQDLNVDARVFAGP
jgi:hypothetical protein